jgi:hypothetical protein
MQNCLKNFWSLSIFLISNDYIAEKLPGMIWSWAALEEDTLGLVLALV